ncbi:unnamed protein product, partial [Musa acuminata var. zebrina]
ALACLLPSSTFTLDSLGVLIQEKATRKNSISWPRVFSIATRERHLLAKICNILQTSQKRKK